MEQEKDIVAILRSIPEWDPTDQKLMNRAADEIERLRNLLSEIHDGLGAIRGSNEADTDKALDTLERNFG